MKVKDYLGNIGLDEASLLTTIMIADGYIQFYHKQDEDEEIMVDQGSLAFMSFPLGKLITSELKIVEVPGIGIQINGITIPVYNLQLGWFSNSVTVIVSTLDLDIVGVKHNVPTKLLDKDYCDIPNNLLFFDTGVAYGNGEDICF